MRVIVRDYRRGVKYFSRAVQERLSLFSTSEGCKLKSFSGGMQDERIGPAITARVRAASRRQPA